MMRLRRYRLFLVVAVFAIVLVYHFSKADAWDSSFESLVGLGTHHSEKLTPAQQLAVPAPVPAQDQFEEQRVQPPHPALPPLEFGSPAPSPPAPAEFITPDVPQTVSGEELLSEPADIDDELALSSESRVEVKLRPAEQGRAYWKQKAEHFPISSQSLKLLPTGEARTLPQIQYKFGDERPAAKKDRLQKQTAVREAFKHAWNGYKRYGLGHDEVKPISKDVGDPFNGWGATLVDSLDTLWIMELYEEFADAVKVVGKIDFKTSSRKDIPLFETVIRYLGGLIGAYDLSSGKYPVLLDKAVELAEILMGTFDTKNRMPAVFYNWAPSYASQPHRGSPHTVLAEIGSLSLEFTRLAQITKEHKYYDAIARITDALEEWQMKTTFPGLWPLRLDASGCKKPEKSEPVLEFTAKDENYSPLPESVTSEVLVEGVEDMYSSGKDHPTRLDKRRQLSASPPQEEPVQKDAEKIEKKPRVRSEWAEEDFDDVDCEPQGLSTEPNSKSHTYGIGSMADSTYEYFPKEYALLGGLNKQYKEMYLSAMEVVREELLYRPMTEQNHDILFLAKTVLSPKNNDPKKRKETFYEGTHLGCYAGGMFALGSKLFGIPSDMAIAERLTDGCVWAYGSTPAGVMPEEFELVPCDSRTACTWDEAKWHKALDPRLEERMQAVEEFNKQQQRSNKEIATDLDEADLEGRPVPYSVLTGSGVTKRDALADFAETPTKTFISDDNDAAGDSRMTKKIALSHADYVAAKIQEQRLPPGYTKISARDYRLRPEAIESVWILYRLTGDETWQQKGWAMFDAVNKATKTEVANAGVKDVTSLLGEQQDTMESFWLAETLKYYYLLFSEPDLISLDEWVLNTEAHPFRRPKAVGL
ncbi:hypothetical protein H2200_011774 [Cladophialophora chaetospira]|uniref:alpha-1,2-Mannosidase n=1 Tax=Cladophialophora chaetospira TaxID=386627 RepID=A0AA38WYR1_9EURO|nr:hypothetical protein H2200_011774 [Cladophialophora chaetospira]